MTYCDTPMCPNPAVKRRQNTKYAEEERNWVVQCDDCFEGAEAHWAVMWAELHGGIAEGLGIDPPDYTLHNQSMESTE